MVGKLVLQPRIGPIPPEVVGNAVPALLLLPFSIAFSDRLLSRWIRHERSVRRDGDAFGEEGVFAWRVADVAVDDDVAVGGGEVGDETLTADGGVVDADDGEVAAGRGGEAAVVALLTGLEGGVWDGAGEGGGEGG